MQHKNASVKEKLLRRNKTFQKTKAPAILNDCVCVRAHRLRELCVKLMFLHPVDYGRKAEELLWRKVYYEVIQVIKTNKKVRVTAAVAGNLPAFPCF